MAFSCEKAAIRNVYLILKHYSFSITNFLLLYAVVWFPEAIDNITIDINIQTTAFYTASMAVYIISIAPYTASMAVYIQSIMSYTVSMAVYIQSIASHTASMAVYRLAIVFYM